MDHTTVSYSLRRCDEHSDDASLTLPGYVLSAEEGSVDVIVTRDLRAFLAPLLVAESSNNRSSLVIFDWRLADKAEARNVTRDGDTVISRGVEGSTSCSRYSLSRVTRSVVSLVAPYCGPRIVAGLPRVYLRTALRPAGLSKIVDPRRTVTETNVDKENISDNSNAYGDVRMLMVNMEVPTTTSVAAGMNVTCGREVRRFRVALPGEGEGEEEKRDVRDATGSTLPVITAMSAHPYLHYLLVGRSDDSVLVLG